MLSWAALFAAIALVAAVFGFAGLITVSVWIAQLLAVIFAVLAGLAVLVWMILRRR